MGDDLALTRVVNSIANVEDSRYTRDECFIKVAGKNQYLQQLQIESPRTLSKSRYHERRRSAILLDVQWKRG